MKRLLVLGAGGHAAVVADAAIESRDYEVIGFADDDPGKIGTTILGNPVLGTIAQALAKTWDVDALIVGIGDNDTRAKLAAAVLAAEHVLGTVIHPAATVAQSARVGSGTAVLAGAVLNPEVTLGDNVIVNTRASIDHHSSIGDSVHVAPGATLGGAVTIGAASLVGIGSAVLPEITVGQGCVIAAGAVVVDAVGHGQLVGGVPARLMRNR